MKIHISRTIYQEQWMKFGCFYFEMDYAQKKYFYIFATLEIKDQKIQTFKIAMHNYTMQYIICHS